MREPVVPLVNVTLIYSELFSFPTYGDYAYLMRSWNKNFPGKIMSSALSRLGHESTSEVLGAFGEQFGVRTF